MDHNILHDLATTADELDRQGFYQEADALTEVLTTTATQEAGMTREADRGFLGMVGDSISNLGTQIGYGVQNFFGGVSPDAVQNHIRAFLDTLNDNTYLTDPNQKQQLLGAINQALIAIGPVTSAAQTATQPTAPAQQQNIQQLYDQGHKAKWQSAPTQQPHAQAKRHMRRVASNRSLPVLIGDLQDIINLTQQAMGGGKYPQITPAILTALTNAQNILKNTPQANVTGQGANKPISQQSANQYQQQAARRYLEFGLQFGPQAMEQHMRDPRYNQTEPFIQWVLNTWRTQGYDQFYQQRQQQAQPQNTANYSGGLKPAS